MRMARFGRDRRIGSGDQPDAVLMVDRLTKTYRRGASPANDGISLQVGRGEVFGLLGHNGAGKTTLVSQIIGLARPDAGRILIGGRDAVADPGAARRACSIQPQAQMPMTGLTPRRAMELVGRFRGGSAADARRRAATLAGSLDIEEWLDTDCSRLSGGVRRLTTFAMAAVVPGSLVILDEPTNDVDPVRRRLLWAQVRALADGGSAVLLVTHNVLEAERAVDRLAVLDHGRVVADGTPGELKSAIAADVRLELVLEPGVAEPPLPTYVRSVSRAGHRVSAIVPGRLSGEAAGWAQGLRQAGVVEEFGIAAATLEDAYVALLGRPAERNTVMDEGEEVSDVAAA